MKFFNKILVLILAINLLNVLGLSLRLNDKTKRAKDNNKNQKNAAEMTNSQAEEKFKEANNLNKEAPADNVKINSSSNSILAENGEEKTIKECLFKTPANAQKGCDCEKTASDLYVRLPDPPVTRTYIRNDIKITIPIKKSYKLFDRQLGISDKSGLFFDYMDDVFQIDIVTEFMEIYYRLFSRPLDPKNDPYEEQYLLTGKSEYHTTNFKIEKPHIVIEYNVAIGVKTEEEFNIENRQLYNMSITIPQLEYAFTAWKWQFGKNSKGSLAKDFLNRYDMNGDGRLSPYELLVGMIYENVENEDCKYCLKKVKLYLQVMFQYIVCDNQHYIIDLQMEGKLRHLIRQSDQVFNIYNCEKDSYVKAIMADFIDLTLASENAYIGALGLKKRDVVSTDEKFNKKMDIYSFKKAILLGFLNRQVDDKFGIYANKDIVEKLTQKKSTNNGEEEFVIDFAKLTAQFYSIDINAINGKTTRWSPDFHTDNNCVPLPGEIITPPCYGDNAKR